MTEQDILKRLSDVRAEKYGENDIQCARLFSDVFPEFAYNETARKWWFFDGARYKPDVEGLTVQSAIKLLAVVLPRYISNLEVSDDERGRLLKWSAKWQTVYFRERVAKDSKSNRKISADQLDADRYLLNVRNGVLKLKQGEISFVPHSSEYLFSKMADVDYDKKAKCPKWQKFLCEIFQNDRDKIRYVQKLIGLCLTGDTRLEQLYFFYGCTTRNGKSTLLESVSSMLGDYSVSVRPESLCQKSFADGGGASADLARLKGARLILVSEFKKNALLDVGLLKLLTGNDRLTTRRLYEDFFSFQIEGKIIVNTNYLPTCSDSTLFASDRAAVVSFDRHFTQKEQDKLLKQKLKSEYSGILLWAIEGLKLFYAEGLEACESIKKATEQYKLDMDKIRNFVNDCLIESSANTAVSDAYVRYSAWCHSNNYGVEGKRNFVADLKSKGLWSPSGTVRGRTIKNVILGYSIVDD